MGSQIRREATSSPALPLSPPPQISLAHLPPLFILPTHFTDEGLFATEAELADLDAPLTYDVNEAKIFIGKISAPKRAALELRSKGLWTEALMLDPPSRSNDQPTSKKRKLSAMSSQNAVPNDSQTTATEDESTSSESISPLERKGNVKAIGDDLGTIHIADGEIIVVNIEWVTASAKEGLLPIEPYIVYKGRTVPKPKGQAAPIPAFKPVTYIKARRDSSAAQSLPSPGRSKEQYAPILSRTRADAVPEPEKGHPTPYQHRRRFNDKSLHVRHQTPPRLHRTTTSEFEASADINIPEPPDWVKHHDLYACLRSTPADPPNFAFISELHKIKKARLLTLDEIGVRAYSTSIASISAYPYKITHPKELLQLPGCDTKIASLWADWHASADKDPERYIPAAHDLDKDEHLRILKLFFDIWGVGAETARKFYYDKGWKEIDDIVEFGWGQLNRVQQIGLKYYDEFLVPIPRGEVESITEVVKDHARKCREIPKAAYGTTGDIEAIIVGGYRRGKSESGDVDMILSHRDESVTRGLVLDVIHSLENEGWITHTLTLNTTTSDRNQQTLPYRGEHHGHGFDSLDKGLCVWQNPYFIYSDLTTGNSIETSVTAEKGKGSTAVRNPNIHRRVDIIISPWRTVGSAILGWSGATTFERDIRRWAKKNNGWKFDSSGVRDRGTGLIVDLESPRKGDEGDRWEDRERRIMEGLGIGWRPATERCTG